MECGGKRGLYFLSVLRFSAEVYMRSLKYLNVLMGSFLFTSELHAGLLIARQAEGPLPDMTVNVDVQPVSDLTEHQTYGWMPAPELRIENPKYKDLELDAWVRQGVDRQMQNKGTIDRVTANPLYGLLHRGDRQPELR
jgi:hypothetical protein